ncbi:MAG: Fic family protein [Deltaproteobacteria bacterium]|nr:Fic family protein [Deltaproteobacteria bacterium]
MTNGNLESLDRKADHVRELMVGATQAQITELWKQLDLSTIYHDWALEGQVILPDELDSAFNNRAVTDATSLPLYMSLRSHRQAIDYSREVASRRKLVFSLDLFREFHTFFASNPENAKAGRYRKEIPLHRSYFHEICHPSKIAASMRKLVAWLNDPTEAIALHPIQWTAKFHYKFMRIFPFIETTGKIARIVSNIVLIRQGYLPSIIHATERQRYYETIRQSQDDLAVLIGESSLSSLEAAEKFLQRSKMAC